MGEKGVCNIEGCDNPIVARGWCRNHYQQWWYHQNLEKERERRSEWRLANQEKIREYDHRWREANLEKARKVARRAQKKKRTANPDKAREVLRRWRQSHPSRVRKYRLNRRAQKANVLFNLTAEQRVDVLAQGCFFAGLGDCNGSLVIAHDVPLSKGGNTTRGNIFCLCVGHNSMMRSKSLAEILAQLNLFGVAETERVMEER